MMAQGILFYDDSNKSLQQKVDFAANRYQQRTGHRPTVCYVNEADVNGSQLTEIDGVRLVIAKTCLRHHLMASEE